MDSTQSHVMTPIDMANMKALAVKLMIDRDIAPGEALLLAMSAYATLDDELVGLSHGGSVRVVLPGKAEVSLTRRSDGDFDIHLKPVDAS